MDSKLEEWMEKAFELASKELELGEVPVGCVFVYDNKITAEGRNSVNETRNPTRHAEINCIDQVMEWCRETKRDWRSVFSKTRVYVTVEPCVMCAAALHNLKIEQIVYGCHNDRFGGCGTVMDVASLYENPVPTISGVQEKRAMKLLQQFYDGINPNAPQPKVKKRKRKEQETE
ncbi:hypothetical protein R5R35_007563 [Gryllus longicercus]|uniref:CMP/dCMP-type deaminase domain-containing protein n=1 Tax=Gryllus longicercus TaxID=2509291 RepID=A0AAN9VVY5_9ORTH|nr:tRNA-specific adenosine deaminase 2 [Gryllus bimaculatus]